MYAQEVDENVLSFVKFQTPAFYSWMDWLDRVETELKENAKTKTYPLLREENYGRVKLTAAEYLAKNVPPENEKTSKKKSSLAKKIKKEKLSVISTSSDKENQETVQMPPPTFPINKKPPRQTIKKEPKRTTRSKALDLQLPHNRTSDIRPSELMMQNDVVPIVEVLDSTTDSISPERKTRGNKNKTSAVALEASVRPKRTKRKKNEEDDSHEAKTTDAESKPTVRQTRTKHKKTAEDANITSASEYEDARASVDSTKTLEDEVLPVQMDATIIIKTNNQVCNETIVVSNPTQFMDETVVLSKNNGNLDDLMTDDDTLEEEKKSDKKNNKTSRKKVAKPLFSAFENSPVKKKVEAFEKIAAKNSNRTPAESRTRAQFASKVNSSSKITPLRKSKLPVSSSTSKVKTPSQSSRPIYIPEKTASALKASQMSYEEKEQRRKEKEKEAQRLRKQELEEKKKLQDEKRLKAQQTREEEERKRKKMIEEQLRKEEERIKKSMMEKQEKLKKQKLEAEKKRLLALQKAMEEKEKQVVVKNEEIKKEDTVEWDKARLKDKNAKKIPIYMLQKAPLLPTDDCYDSDDERGGNKVNVPVWAKDPAFRKTLQIMTRLGYQLRNTLFCPVPQTPDLRKVFENIDVRKLKRTSSAVWKHAPRFTRVNGFNDTFDESLLT